MFGGPGKQAEDSALTGRSVVSEGKSCCTPQGAARCPGSAQSAAAKRPRGSLGQRGSPQTVQEPRAEALLPAAGKGPVRGEPRARRFPSYAVVTTRAAHFNLSAGPSARPSPARSPGNPTPRLNRAAGRARTTSPPESRPCRCNTSQPEQPRTDLGTRAAASISTQDFPG